MDYGCGDGKLAELLAEERIAVNAYYPDAAAIRTCSKREGPVEYGGKELLDRLLADAVRFDKVACSRVLCTTPGETELDAVLRNIRRLVTDSGEALVTVCNPLHLHTQCTELGRKHIPEGKNYEDTFVYTKPVSPSGNLMDEVHHRSLSTYRQAFSGAGFKVKGNLEFDGADTENLLPASDHVVFRLAPMPSNTPQVSPLIKTCLMEWRIIERLVRHQVRQLEEPLGFFEKVVVVDPSDGPFSRQYDRPDAVALARQWSTCWMRASSTG